MSQTSRTTSEHDRRVKRTRRFGGQGGRGETSMVPEAEFESYYGRQIIKTPTWKTPDVPLYLFLGGLAGSSAVLAEGAALQGLPTLERVTRGAAAVGAGLGTVALIHDLGRPERFLNMLRVFKPTSPLSVGSYILAPFATFSSAAFGLQVIDRFPLLARLSGVGAAVFGPLLATYTAALFGNTVVPAWHEAHRELPFVFGGSGAAAGGGLALVLVPVAESDPALKLALAGAVVDLVGVEAVVRRRGLAAEPYEEGKPGRLMKTARALTLSGIALSLLGRRSRLGRAAGGAAYVAGSLTLRFGIFEAGLASARDPKYVVVPQRERLAHREAQREAPRAPLEA